jgi:hypothetical protein
MTYTTRTQKFGNAKTEYNGEKYDSKFEAGVARTLDIRKRAGEIAGWERQYKIECMPYNADGDAVPECKVTHKVDFRVHELDGSFTLIEAKGFETADYKMRRKRLMKFWLPAHPDHEYQVVYQGKKGYRA